MSFARHTIKNFTGSDDLEISACPTQSVAAEVPALVNLIARYGSLYFQHGLLPAQARQMAACLLELADVAETLQGESDAQGGG